jgi:hypothetical protein
MADENKPAAVDETPISPSKTERRNSLEKHLMARPQREELVESKEKFGGLQWSRSDT